MEAEIIPMCEDQGMGIVPWAALGGGLLLSKEQREKKEREGQVRRSYYMSNEHDIHVCNALEEIATREQRTLQSIVRLPFLISQLILMVSRR
jgi:aryl-alcohol dehydrogenase-like predicted oxidoreductase